MIEPAEDLKGASQHVRITCPHCQRSNLRIKRANIGCEVICKQCGNRFLAVLADDPGPIAASTQLGPRESRPSDPAAADRPHAANGEGELQQIFAERDRLRAELREREADRLRLTERADELEALRTDRDRLAVLLERAETAVREAARHEADAHRLAGTIEQDRDQVAAMARRNEELAEQARALGTEVDRLHRDHEDERREQHMSLEALRHELENARALATAASDRAAAAAATRAELEGRLAEFEDQRRVWQERLDAARLPFERDLPPLRDETERLRHQVEILVGERDVALGQIEALGSDRDRLAVLLERAETAGREAARHEADAHRMAGTIEHDRDQLAAMVRRNEELAGQARELGAEVDRLHRDQEDERREQRMSLEALRHELENARALATAASDRAAAAAATRAELEGRLAEFEDQRRVWQERLDAARLPFERDLPPLRDEAERLRHEVEILVRDRDVALGQIEALGSDRDRLAVLLERAETAGREAARHEADAHRLAGTIEHDRDQLAAMVRRNKELAEKARELGTEVDRLHRDQEDERRAQRMSLEALRHELENARAAATAANDRAAAAAATRAELEGRLAEFEDQRRDREERLDAARLQFERDLPPLRDEAERLRHQNEVLVGERDVALRQIEALGSDRDRLAVLLDRAETAGREAARHEADAHRLAGTIEQDRDQLAAMARRNEELAEQARELGTEVDRLHRDQEDERREQRMSQEALRHELESARALATAASDRAAAAAATRAELEGRLAEFEDRLQAANEQSQRLEGEMQAQRDWVAALPSENGPGQSLADGDRESDRLRTEQLTADLDQARAANERLRSLLNVFGLVHDLTRL